MRPGSTPQNPLVLTFTTTAVRDYHNGPTAPDPLADPAAPSPSKASGKKPDAKSKKSKGTASARHQTDDAHSTGELVPRYSVVSTTATHRFVVGTSRASTNRGEFAVVGLTSEAVAAGWGCSALALWARTARSPPRRTPGDASRALPRLVPPGFVGRSTQRLWQVFWWVS